MNNEESSLNSPDSGPGVEPRLEEKDSARESTDRKTPLSGPESESTLVTSTHQNTLPCEGLDIFKLVDQYHNQVYRYAFRLSGNQTDAEDLAQQTFMIAHQKISQLRDQNKAVGWLVTIARSCFLKSIRRQRPASESTLQMSVDELPRDASGVSQIDRMALQDALQEISEDYRVILVMFYFDNCSYREIAEELNIKIGTVMSRLSRAKALMRHKLIGVQS